MAFYTPDGQYTVADIMFNAGTNIPVRGYMQVTANGAAEIGVYEGRLVLNTATGAKTIDSNNLIQLAQVDVPTQAPPVTVNEDEEDDNLTPLYFVGGTLVVAGAVIAISNDSDDSPTIAALPTTPDTPTTPTQPTTRPPAARPPAARPPVTPTPPVPSLNM
jgi:hypothetical protein